MGKGVQQLPVFVLIGLDVQHRTPAACCAIDSPDGGAGHGAVRGRIARRGHRDEQVRRVRRDAGSSVHTTARQPRRTPSWPSRRSRRSAAAALRPVARPNAADESLGLSMSTSINARSASSILGVTSRPEPRSEAGFALVMVPPAANAHAVHRPHSPFGLINPQLIPDWYYQFTLSSP